MAVPAEIRELTERFERTKDAYRSPQYNETQLRREFLDPLNSWLITWRHHRRSPKAKKALFPKVLVSDLKHIPVPKLSPTNPADKSRHDQTVRLVEQMLELHQRLAAARTPQEKTSLERQIAATDAQIDRLVYDLYGLTEDEIKIVEGTI